MMNAVKFGFCLGLVVSVPAGQALAAEVYLFSTGNTAVDNAYLSSLSARGHNVVIGRPWSTFDGTVNLASFDVVLMTHSGNWSSSSQQVPVVGQEQLVAFVRAGGGLITTEWIVYNNGTSSGAAYATLMTVLPVTYGSSWNSNDRTTLSRVTPDQLMNNGLPETFMVPNVSFAGTESRLTAKPGATVFYQSSNLSSPPAIINAGVAGWDVQAGRVVSISTMPGVASLNDTNYATLLSNIVRWVSNDPGCAGDWNGDGTIDFNDLLSFLNDFEAQAPRADITADGVVDFNDFLAFLNFYTTPC
jgi:hypothetical protein